MCQQREDSGLIQQSDWGLLDGSRQSTGPQDMFSRAGALLALASSLIVLGGWIFDVPSLTNLFDNLPSMKVNTALGFTILSMGILACNQLFTGPCPKIAGTLVGSFMLTTIIQYPLQADFGIDQLLYRDPSGEFFPGRASPATCVSFIILSVTMMVPTVKRLEYRGPFLTLLMLGASIPAAAFLAYLFDPTGLIRVPFFSTMAVHTAIGFLFLYFAVGLTLVELPGKDARMHSSSWRLLQLLLIPVIVFPVILAYLLFKLERLGMVSPVLTISILVAGFCISALSGVLWAATREDRWLNLLKHEMDRRLTTEAKLGTVLDTISGGVVFFDRGGKIRMVNNGFIRLVGAADPNGKNIDQFIPVTEKNRFHQRLENLEHRFESPEDQHPELMRLLREDGQEVHALVSICRLPAVVQDMSRFGALIISSREIERQFKRLRDEARFDHLTEILNRTSYELMITGLEKHGTRHGEQVGLLMLDLDHFKQINDSFGHAAGDAALLNVAQTVHGMLRQGDNVYRYGGEEFAVVAFDVRSTELVALAERIRKAISAVDIEHGGFRFQVTCSVGVALWSGDESIRMVQEKADRALYQAKECGRDQVVMWPEGVELS